METLQVRGVMLNCNVFSTWRRSLEFFQARSLKLFFLVSLKTYVRSLLFLLRYFWHLIFFVLGVHLCGYFESTFLYLFLNFSLFFVFLLVLRPSLENKSFMYFVNYLQKIGGFIIVNCSIVFFFLIYPFFANYLNFTSYFLKLSYFLFFGILIPATIVASLLFLEVRQSFKNIYFSVYRAFKMIFLFYPAFLILGLIGLCLNMTVIRYLSTLNILSFSVKTGMLDLFFESLKFIAVNLLRFFFLSVMTMYYLKIKHANYKQLF